MHKEQGHTLSNRRLTPFPRQHKYIHVRRLLQDRCKWHLTMRGTAFVHACTGHLMQYSSVANVALKACMCHAFMLHEPHRANVPQLATLTFSYVPPVAEHDS